MSKVILIGDMIEDIDRLGHVAKLCPEAPVLDWVCDKVETRNGGLGLVAENLKALGIHGTLIPRSMSRKIRLWDGRHLLFRESQDSVELVRNPSLIDQVVADAAYSVESTFTVVVSDYDKGGISENDARVLTAWCVGTGTPLFVDTKKADPDCYKGAFAIFPNAKEAPSVESTHFQHVIRKDGANGCFVDDLHIPTEAVEEFDVTGAGDVFLAAFVAHFVKYGYGDYTEQARFANRAAGISVKHRGGYVLTADDVKTLEAV